MQHRPRSNKSGTGTALKIGSGWWMKVDQTGYKIVKLEGIRCKVLLERVWAWRRNKDVANFAPMREANNPCRVLWSNLGLSTSRFGCGLRLPVSSPITCSLTSEMRLPQNLEPKAGISTIGHEKLRQGRWPPVDPIFIADYQLHPYDSCFLVYSFIVIDY